MEEIPIIIVLLLCLAYFSAVEIALFSITEAKLRSVVHAGGKAGKQAQRVINIKKNPEKLLATILIILTVLNISSASVATGLAIDVFDDNGVEIATVIMTIVILIFGEVLPKTLGQRHAELFARLGGPSMSFVLYALTPVTFFLERMAKFVAKLTGGKPSHGVSEEEVKALLHMGSESGNVEAAEREMIENIFTLNDVTAEDVMTQATDMVAINMNLNPREILHIMMETGFSRLPAYSGNIDHIEGILYGKDVMEELVHFKGPVEDLKLRPLVKPAMYVPEQKALDDLLKSFQREKKHIAIVVNEYGETRGIITLEDILEEIVGDISDEQDEESGSIRRINSKTIVVDADVDIDDIQEVLDVEIHDEVHKSIAWFILNELGEVPEKGDELTAGNVKIIIEEAEESKIKRVKLIKIR